MTMPNVLSNALKILPSQDITYKKFTNNIVNEVGNQVPQYAEPIIAKGSLQPAGASLLWKLGLADIPDLWVCYIRANVISESDASSGDLIIDSNGRVFNIFRTDNWFQYPNQDWNKLLIQRKKNYGN